MIAEKTQADDCEALMAGQTATQVGLSRERRRQEGNGFILPPPLPLADLARARLEPPEPGSSQTLARPNAELVAMQRWLQDTYDIGGTRADLQRCWGAWQSEVRGA